MRNDRERRRLRAAVLSVIVLLMLGLCAGCLCGQSFQQEETVPKEPAYRIEYTKGVYILRKEF